MNKKWTARTALFLGMILVTIILAEARLQNSRDRLNKKINLSTRQTVTCTVDLGRLGAVKQMLNPNMYTLYLRIVADSPKPLRCEGSGMEMFLSQGTKKGIWRELKPGETLRQRGGVIPLNVELKVPYGELKKKNVAEGTLKFFAEDEPYSEIMIKVVNSQAGKKSIGSLRF